MTRWFPIIDNLQMSGSFYLLSTYLPPIMERLRFGERNCGKIQDLGFLCVLRTHPLFFGDMREVGENEADSVFYLDLHAFSVKYSPRIFFNCT